VDGREPDVVLTCYIFYSDRRNGGALYWRFNACGRWWQPAQEQLNQ
jgi:hypothetical protein